MNTRARHHLLLIPLLLSPLAAAPEHADAQTIRRCNGPDGTTIFTDRSCAAFGATLSREVGYGNGGAGSSDLREPPENLGTDGAKGSGFAMRGCAQSREALIAGVRAAIESGDVNRLSNYYHWTGTSTSTAFALMDRLDQVARNTLSGVQFDYPYDSTYDTSYQVATADTGAATIDPLPVQRIEPAGRVAFTTVSANFEAGVPAMLERWRSENDDVAYASGIVDASAKLEDVLPQMVAAKATDGSGNATSGNGLMVDASTPLDVARGMTMAGGVDSTSYSTHNPQPVALRVNNGGGTSTRFSLRQNAGCWFIQF